MEVSLRMNGLGGLMSEKLEGMEDGDRWGTMGESRVDQRVLCWG